MNDKQMGNTKSKESRVSDIQELIHRQGVISFNTGVKTERERIVKLIEQAINENGKHSWRDVVELIKEQDA